MRAALAITAVLGVAAVPAARQSTVPTPRDVNDALQATQRINTGIVYVNAPTIGAEIQLPFGGTKQTGNGHREGSAATAIEIFTEWKTVYVDHSGRLQKAQIDNN